jgi:hypothetical protein
MNIDEILGMYPIAAGKKDRPSPQGRKREIASLVMIRKAQEGAITTDRLNLPEEQRASIGDTIYNELVKFLLPDTLISDLVPEEVNLQRSDMLIADPIWQEVYGLFTASERKMIATTFKILGKLSYQLGSISDNRRRPLIIKNFETVGDALVVPLSSWKAMPGFGDFRANMVHQIFGRSVAPGATK